MSGGRGVTKEDLGKDYEKTWVEFWEPIIAPRGEISLDQIKRELHDYRGLLEKLPAFFDEITGGRVSKPNTDLKVVLELTEQKARREFANHLRDWAEEWENP